MPKISGYGKNIKINIEKWAVHFYNPNTKKIIAVNAREGSIVIGVLEDAVNSMTELKVEDWSKIIEPEKIIKKLMKNTKQSVGNIMLTLHNKKIGNKEKIVWSVVFVLSTLNILSYHIDAKTGRQMKTEKDSLMRKISRAG